MDPDSNSNLHRKAIDAALSYKWEDAVKLNKQIIKDCPEDIDCLNRLAKALFELGKYPQAKKIYSEVLKIDPYNVIAQKNLKKISAFKKNSNHVTPLQNHLHVMSPSLFLEEAGVTKVINLIKLAEPQKLSAVSPGDMVVLCPKNRGITVTDENGNYLGVLPDDLSHLLIKLIKGGNKYQSFVKSVKPNTLSILIREIFRAKRFRNQPSFIADSKIMGGYSTDHISLVSDDNEDSSEEASEGEDAFPV